MEVKLKNHKVQRYNVAILQLNIWKIWKLCGIMNIKSFQATLIWLPMQSYIKIVPVVPRLLGENTFISFKECSYQHV